MQEEMNIDMAVRSEIKDPLKEKLFQIVFTDPLSESTKKAKRNLLLISFIGLIIGVYSVRVESFLGFRISSNPISDQVLNGMVASILLYFLILFLSYLIIDLLAWNFKVELIKRAPYIDLLRQVKENTVNIKMSLNHTILNIENIYSKIIPQTSQEMKDIISGTNQQIISLKNSHDKFIRDDLPKILEEQKRIKNISRINYRVLARLLFLSGLEILLPVGLCGMALSKTISDLIVFFDKIFS